MSVIKIAKVQVTSAFSQWWESNLDNILVDVPPQQIISAIVENGGLYLVYWYIDKQ